MVSIGTWCEMVVREPYRRLHNSNLPSISWTEVKPHHKVIDHGTHYSVNGMLVTWSSHDSKEAQHILKYLSKHGGR